MTLDSASTLMSTSNFLFAQGEGVSHAIILPADSGQATWNWGESLFQGNSGVKDDAFDVTYSSKLDPGSAYSASFGVERTADSMLVCQSTIGVVYLTSRQAELALGSTVFLPNWMSPWVAQLGPRSSATVSALANFGAGISPTTSATSFVRTTPPSETATRELEEVLLAERLEDVEYGAEPEFERRFRRYLARFRSLGVDVLSRNAPRFAQESLHGFARLLQLLGEDRDSTTLRLRFDVLRAGLRSKSAVLRDASALGLYRLPDERVELELREARKAEPVRQLQKTLEHLLAEIDGRR